MKKTKRINSIRIKRKNQNSRKQAKKANKQTPMSLVKKIQKGIIVINDNVPLRTKHIWPNQAQPQAIL